jgi:steroid delta-isomerase-like uncharacterized protein
VDLLKTEVVTSQHHPDLDRIEISPERDDHTVIIIMDVEPANQDALVEALGRPDEWIKTVPGYRSHAVCRGIDGTFVVLYAQWASKEQYDAFHHLPESARPAEVRQARAFIDTVVTRRRANTYRAVHTRSAAPAAEESNRDVLERAVELINAGKVAEGVTALFAEDAVDHDPAPGQGPGRAGFLDFFGTLTAAFPDLRLTPRHLTSDDEHVSMAFTVSGTHRGAFNGVPPSGRSFKVSGVEIFRFADGRVVERWGLTDDMSLLGQLGLLPEEH